MDLMLFAWFYCERCWIKVCTLVKGGLRQKKIACMPLRQVVQTVFFFFSFTNERMVLVYTKLFSRSSCPGFKAWPGPSCSGPGQNSFYFHSASPHPGVGCTLGVALLRTKFPRGGGEWDS